MGHREGIREYFNMKLDGLKVIDWGCGTKPIQNYLPDAKEYFTIDKLAHVSPDVVAEIDSDTLWIGVLDGKHLQDYDVAFCLEVLEHVNYPERALKNIATSLKPNGLLCLSVPFLYPVHSDEDLWRFTDQGLKRLLERNGFEVIDIRATTPKQEGWVLKAKKI